MSSSKSKQPLRLKISVAVDVLMIFAIFVDILWIAFDGIFEVGIFNNILRGILPGTFMDWYAEVIDKDFLFYESRIFIPIFLTELFVKWAFAIYYRSHEKWFFYPILHWYDVLGCIPTSSFRILRFLRVLVLLYKLHRWKVIDLNNYSIFRYIVHYYDIAVEEISDRVAVNLLEEAKSELKRGEPISNMILREVLTPHRAEIVDWTASHVQTGLHRHYQANRKEIQAYLQKIVQETVEENKEISNLERIPLLGSAVAESINKAVREITFGVIDRLSADLADSDNNFAMVMIVDAITDVVFSLNENASDSQKNLSNQIISESIDLIIERVKVKKWKIKEEEERFDDLLY